MGFNHFRSALHFYATIQDATSLLHASIKGQRAPNVRLYFGESTGLWEVQPQPGKEGTMGPGEIVLVIPEFNLQNSRKNSGHGATHV